MGGPLNILLGYYTDCTYSLYPMTVEVTPRSKYEQKNATEPRKYVLNVAQQFLQAIDSPYNPFTSKLRFEKLCGLEGQDTRCFYRNLSDSAKAFLLPFQSLALQRIVCASIRGDVTFEWPNNKPIQTPLWIYGADTSSLFATDGKGILRNIAAVTLVAAAFDLCYTKHHITAT